jgi:hypothetical protein
VRFYFITIIIKARAFILPYNIMAIISRLKIFFDTFDVTVQRSLVSSRLRHAGIDPASTPAKSGHQKVEITDFLTISELSLFEAKMRF